MPTYQEYLQATLGGDKNAFSEVVKLFEQRGLLLARRWIGNSGLAEDAVQEAFLAAYAGLPHLRHLDAFPAWFRSILRSCVSRVLREQESHLPLSELDESVLKSDTSPDPDEDLLRSQNRAIVAKILASLDGVVREACIQHYIYDLSCKEIATMLDVPVGTIRRRLHDGRARIIRQLKVEDRPIILVGHLPITDHLLAMVSHHAHDQATYKIRLKKFLSWASLAASLEGGLLDAAFIMAPLAMALRNKGLEILYVLDGHHNGSAITVRRDASVKTIPSGSAVGLPHSISTHRMIFTDMFNSDPYAAASNMMAKYISPSYLTNSLVSHQVDAFFCAEPWNAKSVFEGIGRIYARSRDLYPGHMCCILVVTEEFAARRGDVLRCYIMSLLSAGKYITANPDRAAMIQTKYTGVPACVAEWVLKNSGVSFDDLFPDRGRLEWLMALACKTGVLDRPCDLDAFTHTPCT